jgi:4-aminobutyrate aminotransferase
LCNRHRILLITDEVQCGIGRTGRWWGSQHFSVEPDIVCSAKGIASGLPLGAMIARRSVMTWEHGAHGNTYGGNPLACVAALETLRLVESGYMQNAQVVGELVLSELRAIARRHASIGQVRGMGLMIGIEFVRDPVSKKPAHDLMEKVIHAAFERGLLLLGCGQSVIRFAPALNIPVELASEAMNIFEDALVEVEAQAGVAPAVHA